jgi:hypothetical protein
MSRFCSLVLACLVVGCGAQGAGDPPVEIAAPAAPVVPAAPVAPVGPAPEAPAAVVAVAPDGKVGVAACDEYLEVYRGCIPSLKAEERGHHDKVVEQLAAAWGQAHKDPKVADSLVDTCTSTRAASKVALPDCKW